MYRLHLNENLFVSEKFIKKVVLEAAKEVDVRLYPEFYGKRLALKIAEKYGLEEENILIYGGLEPFLHVFASYFFNKNVVIVEPTFEFYSKVFRSSGVRIKSALLTAPLFNLDSEKVLDIAKKSSAILLASPNNPTGNQFRKNQVLNIIENFDGLIIVDEAYAEYGRYSLIKNILEYENLIILRTFSKAWGLAGIRIGYIASSQKIINIFKEYSSPVSFSSLSLEIAIKILSYEDKIMSWIREMKETKKWFIERLREIDVLYPYPSDANFVLVKVLNMNSKKLVEKLYKRGFIVKDVSYMPLCKNHIRITVPPKDIGEKLIEAIKASLDKTLV